MKRFLGYTVLAGGLTSSVLLLQQRGYLPKLHVSVSVVRNGKHEISRASEDDDN